MKKGPSGKIVLHHPKAGLRWIVDSDDLAYYVRGSHNFTIRVPYFSEHAGKTNARTFEGFLLVFKKRATITVVDSKENLSLTAYELSGAIRPSELRFFQQYMRAIKSSFERRQLGTKIISFTHPRSL